PFALWINAERIGIALAADTGQPRILGFVCALPGLNLLGFPLLTIFSEPLELMVLPHGNLGPDGSLVRKAVAGDELRSVFLPSSESAGMANDEAEPSTPVTVMASVVGSVVPQPGGMSAPNSPSDRVLRQIDRLLDGAEESMAQGDTASLHRLATAVLVLDPGN